MTFDEWWKANSYKYAQADYGGGYEEIARAAWDAATEVAEEQANEAAEDTARWYERNA